MDKLEGNIQGDPGPFEIITRKQKLLLISSSPRDSGNPRPGRALVIVKVYEERDLLLQE
jgi:hypothetical protein